MEKIIDIYAHFRNDDEMYNRSNGWFGRIIVDENKLVEGIVSSYDEDNRSFVFGTLDEDFLNLTQCSRNEGTLPNEIIAELDKSIFKGIISEVSYDEESPSKECRVILIPADKTREESEFELVRLKAKIEDIKREIPASSRGLYHLSRIQNKENQKVKK